MSTSSIALPAFGGSIRIVTLPLGYETANRVKHLVEEELSIGQVLSVRIQGRKTPQGVQYSTAFIDFKSWALNNDLIGAIEDSTYDEHDQPLTDLNQAKTICVREGSYKWANGRVMEHLAIRPVDYGMGGAIPSNNDSVSTGGPLPVQRGLFSYGNVLDTPLTSNVVPGEGVHLDCVGTSWNSIYIPVFPKNLALDMSDGTYQSVQSADIQNFCEKHLQLGRVSRVDFISRTGTDQPAVQGAFVHFEHWNNNGPSTDVRIGLNHHESIRVHGGFLPQYPCGPLKFVTIQNGKVEPAYLVFKINHKPLPQADTSLNTAQLVAANKYLEEKIAEKDALIGGLMAALEVRNTAAMVNGQLIADDSIEGLSASNSSAPDCDALGEDGLGPMQVSELA